MTNTDSPGAAAGGAAKRRTRTIRARIAQGAVQRVTSFYNASIGAILGEMYQNARRSGATDVRVDIDRGTMTVTVSDNGNGIGNPEAVLSFGQSDWSEAIADEHPAGMGLYSLSRRGATITSRTAALDGSWRVHLQPEHFRGEAPATIEPFEPDGPVGTTVTFPITKNDDIGYAVHVAQERAVHMPLKVTVCGERVAHRPFMESEQLAGLIVDDDLMFGVAYHENRGGADPDNPTHRDLVVNFHGHVVTDRDIHSPVVRSLDGWWSACVEVKRCPALELVLPAREKVIANSYLPTLLERMEHAIYEVIEQTGKPRSLIFEHARRAKEAGYDIDCRDDRLLKWTCMPADPGWHGYPETATGEIPPDALIVSRKLNASQRTMLDLALHCEKADMDKAETEDGSPTRSRLFAETKALDRFEWYDRIPRVVDLHVEIEDGGTVSRPAGNYARSRLADRVWIVLSVEQRDGGAGATKTIRLETDMALSCDDHAEFASGAGLVLSRNRRTDRRLIAEAVSRALFVTSDNCDASWTSQEESFSEDLEIEMTTLLDGADAGLETAIRNALYGLPKMPSGTSVHMTSEDGGAWNIKTSLGAPPEPETGAGDPAGDPGHASM